MTDDLRTRIAAVVLDVLNEAKAENLRWRMSASGIIANRLIAAGVTMPAPAPAIDGGARTENGISVPARISGFQARRDAGD